MPDLKIGDRVYFIWGSEMLHGTVSTEERDFTTDAHIRKYRGITFVRPATQAALVDRMLPLHALHTSKHTLALKLIEDCEKRERNT